jgi:hypothetical protein
MTIAGELVTEELAYDGGRQVTAYLSPDSPEAVMFAGDGQLISRWGAALKPVLGSTGGLLASCREVRTG